MYKVNFYQILFQSFLLLVATSMLSQNPIPATSGHQRSEAGAWRKLEGDRSLTASMEVESIGPTIMSGRITDIDVNPQNENEFYISYASGGLWYSNNNGTSFTPVFDYEAVMTIGDFGVHWPSHTIYVGTGEVNSSRSSYAGNGIYKSADKGKSWTHMGLVESHHIGKVWVHPNDADKVVVTVLGHLYSSNPERGIYITEDGGKNWLQTLYINDVTGAVDLIADFDNPNILYASTWQKERRAWNLIESGLASSVYKSSDGGKSWTNIALEKSGFPQGEGKGRIGLSLSKKDGKNYLYAVIDNFDRRPLDAEDKDQKLKKGDFKSMTAAAFDLIKDEDLKIYLEENDFPEKYDVKKVRQLVKNKKITVQDLGTYHEEENALQFDTDVIGAEIYLSTDEGRSWKKVNEKYMDIVYYYFGYYFGVINSQRDDPNVIYIPGVPLLKSVDGGKTWKNIDGENSHGDHHVLWINPAKSNHLLNGNDGGLNISYDGGKNWIKCNTPPVGQFYTVNVDNDENYNVYGGLQDNGVWYGKNTYEHNTGWHQTGVYPYKFLTGGDGMQVQIDNRDNTTVYTGSQFGNYFRINRKAGDRKFITPKHDLGEKPYRWNWQSPILLSPHNQDILYMGANKLLRSMDKGDSFKSISDDLTKGGKKGDIPFGTLTTIDESVLKFGLIYTGADDGSVYVTRDGGNSWLDIGGNLPQDLWVSRIQASKHEEARVYVSLNGYRWDHFKPYLFVSEDYGQTWRDIGKSLPDEPINVIREDLENEDILFVGTDNGLYVSTDRGQSFTLLSKQLPNAAIHDLAIQKREGHLLIGSHGRSLFKINIKPIRRLEEVKNKEIFVFDKIELRENKQWGKTTTIYEEAREAKSKLTLFSKEAGIAQIHLICDENKVLSAMNIELKKGISTYEIKWLIDEKSVKDYEKWINKGKKEKLEIKAAQNGKFYPLQGEYIIKVVKGIESSETKLIVK